MRIDLTTMLAASAALASFPVLADTPAETAAAFGARQAVQDISLSPDGTQIAFIVPTAGQGAELYTVALTEGAAPRAALIVGGKPERLAGCAWVSNDRLTCTVYGVVESPTDILPFSRVFAVNAKGGDQTMLSTRTSDDTIGSQLYGGGIIDWHGGHDGSVLMQRNYLPKVGIDSLIKSSDTRAGIGVDRVDTRTLVHTTVEQPKGDAEEYITDGIGNVRIAGFNPPAGQTGYSSKMIRYSFRAANSHAWQPLGTYDMLSHVGFAPYAVDAKRDVAIGLEKQDGRYALVEKSLDGTGAEKTLFRRPDVDVGGLAQIGRQRRVVGATYETDVTRIAYFDPDIKAMDEALRRALPQYPIVDIIDASEDENRLLIRAASDNDPGRYYVYDRAAHKLQVLMQARPQLEGRTLATVRAITYPAADGTMIPAYLTLPPGGVTKGLPTIVMPHGGPSARDDWGFDWFSQFYAARGYAVLQPQYRGSSGYGDSWFRDQGFKKWRVAIGDVDDAGRWLVAQGIADPKKLVIVGWSYGGYAALQSAVLDPGLFKAVVAVAPVTDLFTLKEQYRHWSDFTIASQFIGDGPHIVEGSPAQNAGKIIVPVLLVHGTADANVRYVESTMMQSRLRSSGGQVEMLSFPGLDHQLDDGAARARMLEKSDAFIRAAIGR